MRPEVHIDVTGRLYTAKTAKGTEPRSVPEYDPRVGKTVLQKLDDEHDITSISHYNESGEAETSRLFYPQNGGPVVVEDANGKLRKIGIIYPKEDKE